VFSRSSNLQALPSADEEAAMFSRRVLSTVLALGVCIAPAASAAESDPPQRVDADREWRAYSDALAPIGERMVARLHDPDDAEARFGLYRFLHTQLSLAYANLVYQDPRQPDWIPYFNGMWNQAFPNPDDTYYMAPLDGNGVYRIRGYRGTVRITDFSIAGGPLVPQGTGVFGRTFANYDLNTLHVDERGWFDVILSAERPAGHTGDWWQLDPNATYMMVRQVSYDWLRETDARIAIERLDQPAVKARPDAAAIDAALRRIPGWVEAWTDFSLGWYTRTREKWGLNKVAVIDYRDVGGLTTQRYMEAAFELEAGQALLIETAVPKTCRYWNVQLADEFWASVDWMNRHSSINGHAARIDKDGRFRVIVSAEDPGVPNWLDTSGIKRGIFYGRWTECDSTPTPTATLIELADARKHLPADTPAVSAAQRDATIRERRMAVQLRKRW
jgi:Protein of unknown function (DUF1214)